ncbi:MAG: hypothetical protein JWM95_2279 [Gemmatimonadetes bacterium]|nr:hypothetical protein [Gemmatimonadota bacterium]
MLAYLVAAALLQATPVPPQKTQAPGRDSTAGAQRPKREPRKIPVTAQHLTTAFHDDAAKSLLLLARDARMRQDSALLSYDATTLQRISAGVGFTKFGRDRLAFRSEQSTHVRWRRGIGAYVDVTGSRTVVPIAGQSATVRMDGDISPIPYYPGSETLWIGSNAARQAVDENQGVVNPLAEGSEAYYTYEVGDSATFRLPDGKAIRLRELKVRPRTPRWNLAVGSLWFDLSGGQLVRAAYRMSVPMDIKAVAEEGDSSSFHDVPMLVKPLLFPMTASISAIGVEYGLYQGRFWLPRLQVLEGGMNMSFVHSPFKLEQKFTYENVNSGETLPPIVAAPNRGRGGGVQVGVAVGGKSKADVDRETRRDRRMKAQCDSTGNRTYTRQPEGNPNPVFTIIPCDSLKLANSPDLPPSIYDKGEETFDAAEMDALVKNALSMGAQPDFAPQLPTLALDNFRYNRIEGLSVGGHAAQQLGAGYALYAGARFGLADLHPNAQAGISRSDLRRTLTLSGYHRLVSASDWGNPLSLGSSISAFLFGRDEGFYYRATGLELSSVPDDAAGGAFIWSVFAEHQNTATPRTTFSLARVVHGSAFEPNFVATEGPFVGARTRMTNTLGIDPDAFRLFSDVRLEGGLREATSYGRAAVDLTASHGVRSGAVSLTLAGGTSLGGLPVQRMWYLGGTQTVRGQRPGTEVGNAFWLTRIEAALGSSIIRPVVFADMGWAGSRNNLGNVGVPMSGAGFGWSMMDGLVRFDVARGINPRKQWRMDTYVEARF